MAEVDDPGCFWYLVTYIDGEPPELRKFGDVGGLRSAIMVSWPAVKLLNEDVVFYIFFGVRAMISDSDQPCLLHPDGTLIPLYDPEEEIKLLEHGCVNRRDEAEVTEVEDDSSDGVYDGYAGVGELSDEQDDSLTDDEEEEPPPPAGVDVDVEVSDVAEEEPAN